MPKTRCSPRQDLGLIKNGNSYVHMTSKILLMHKVYVEYYWDSRLIIFHMPLTLLLLAQNYVLYNSDILGHAFPVAAPVFYRNLCTSFFKKEFSSLLGS